MDSLTRSPIGTRKIKLTVRNQDNNKIKDMVKDKNQDQDQNRDHLR